MSHDDSLGHGDLLPRVVTPPPGPAAAHWVQRLAAVECPAITARRTRRGGVDPIVWAAARGSNVLDVDGNRYVDLSAGFAVAGVGHAHPAVVEAVREQAGRLVHGMGDLFPTCEKIRLGELLAEVTPAPLQASILALGGSDAVEAALKTAMIATGRRRILAFSGSYHGLSLGALGVTGYRDSFRAPFGAMAGATELRLPYPTCDDCPIGHTYPSCEQACVGYVERLLDSDVSGSEDIAAIIVEPIQGRGGDVVPPPGWLARLRQITAARGILLVLDEIYTGFGRTGDWFACEAEGVVPDLLVVGKGMAGGFPIGACIGTREVMDAWGASAGEAIHTSTFLGNPVACAAGIAAIEVLRSEGLVARAASQGARLRAALEQRIGGHPRVGPVRGRGLMLGVPLLDHDGAPWDGGGVQAMYALLGAGFIVSPGGHRGDVLSLAPPFVITDDQVDAAVDAIGAWVDGLS